MSVREVRLKFPRDTFFSKGNREIVLRARGLTGTWCADPNLPGKSDWLLAFELPRGSYATMIIRQLMNDSNDLEWETDDEESI
jgi:tRNA pseudouridine13 synthase